MSQALSKSYLSVRHRSNFLLVPAQKLVVVTMGVAKIMSVTSIRPCNALQTTRSAACRPRCGAVITRAAGHVVNAAAASPSNLVGIHSGVFVGDWRPQDAECAIKGAKDAGFDLIERADAS